MYETSSGYSLLYPLVINSLFTLLLSILSSFAPIIILLTSNHYRALPHFEEIHPKWKLSFGLTTILLDG